MQYLNLDVFGRFWMNREMDVLKCKIYVKFTDSLSKVCVHS